MTSSLFPTDIVTRGDAAVRDKTQIQRFLLPDGVHQHQRLSRKAENSRLGLIKLIQRQT